MQANVEALQAPVPDSEENAGDHEDGDDMDTSETRPDKSSEKFAKTFTAAPIKILFVLDDSFSTNAIITNVRQGFESISKSNYPVETKMATTYMSPACYFSDTVFNI